VCAAKNEWVCELEFNHFIRKRLCVKAPNLSNARRALTQTKQLTQRGLTDHNGCRNDHINL
jgi:hypothetical protein